MWFWWEGALSALCGNEEMIEICVGDSGGLLFMLVFGFLKALNF